MCEEVSDSEEDFSAITLELSAITHFLSFRTGQRMALVARTASSSSRSSALLPYSPKRTHAKPGKGQGEQDCNTYPPSGCPVALIFHVLPDQGNATNPRHRKKKGADHFQPQEVEDMRKRPCHGLGGAYDRAYSPVPLGTLGRQLGRASRNNTRLPCAGKSGPALDFTSLRRYNDATRKRRTVALRSASKPYSGTW